MNFSIRSKITAPYVVLALTVALGGAFIVTQLILDSIEERFDNQVIETAKLTVEAFYREEQQLLETLRVIVNTEGVAEAAVNADSSELRELIFPVLFNSQDEFVLIFDLSGHSILSITQPESGLLEEYSFTKGDQQLADLPLLQKVLNSSKDRTGDKFSGHYLHDGRAYFMIAGPITDDSGELVGGALIGRSTASLVRIFRETTFAQATIYDLNGQVNNSTHFSIPEVSPHEVENVLSNKDSQITTRDTFAENIQYREILFTWQARDNQELGIIGSAIPTGFLVQANTFSRINVFILTGLILLTVIVVGIFIANIISKPLIMLKNAASEVAEGDLSVQVNPQGEDEIATLTVAFNDMVNNLRSSKYALLEAYDKTIEGWAKALELRDADTEGHSQRVTTMTLDLAKKMGYRGEQLEHIRRGALLHDIGKMAIPDKILRKPKKLSKKELALIRQHPVFAKELIDQIEYLLPSLDIPYSHHENWDGTGYPQGLKGEEIPRPARIFTIVDVWDAIRSDRAYRPAMNKREAKKVIKDGRGTLFDPQIVDIFLKYITKKKNA